MKILFIGDIVGSLGRKTAKEVLTRLKKRDTIAIVVANADNLAHGRGATGLTIKECVDFGVDIFTGGDHLFHIKGFQDEISSLPIARPTNFYNPVPGKGYFVSQDTKYPFCVVSLIGSTFGGGNVENAFYAITRTLNDLAKKGIRNILVDIHGDLTSEKIALGYFLDGKVSAVVGTHTHVATCDQKILEKGTAFVTDVGMVGAYDSVLGVKKEIIIQRFLSSLPTKFEWVDTGKALFNSVLIDVDEKTGKAKSIERKDFVVRG
jgi:metallophosphoesterase (TIGR00282 family)